MERRAAAAIAIGRIVIGAGLLAAPAKAGARWLGVEADRPAAQELVRGLGARDVGLGVGLLAALGDGPAAARWQAAAVVGDLADVVGALAAGDAIPTSGRVGTILLAGGSAAAGAVLAVRLARG